MSAVTLFRRIGLGLLPIALVTLTFCKKNNDAAPAKTLQESQVFENGKMVSSTTFTYDSKGNITDALVHNYNASGTETGSYTTHYTYAADGRLLQATSPLNTTTLGYDGTNRYTACHTVWADSASRPNYKSTYVLPATGGLKADSLRILRTTAGKADYYHMAYKYVNGRQTGIRSDDGQAWGQAKLNSDGTRFEGMVVKEGDTYSKMALVYSHELAHEDFMQPFMAIQHVAAAQCPYFSPQEKMDENGFAHHLLDAFSVSDTGFAVPTPVYSNEPAGKLTKHTVVVGNKTYVYYSN